MGVFGKEKKGMSCEPSPDGSSVVCKRIVRDQKTGEILTDGQIVEISADPSNNCEPRFSGSTRVMDDEWGKFEDVAKKVSAGCRKNSQVGKGE